MQIPNFVREAVEELAFQARQDRRVDKRSGVSQRMPISVLESVVSNAERRALAAGETTVVPRILDIYAALPSMTGKLELEYEGELKGADVIGRELIRAAVSHVFDGHFPDADVRQVVEWFDLGGSLNLGDLEPAADVLGEAKKVQGLLDLARQRRRPRRSAAPWLAAAVDFVLEGLYAQKKISRSDGRGFHGSEAARRPPQPDRRTPCSRRTTMTTTSGSEAADGRRSGTTTDADREAGTGSRRVGSDSRDSEPRRDCTKDHQRSR